MSEQKMQSETNAIEKDHVVFRPLFYRLGNTAERKDFEQLLGTPGIQVINRIEGQLKELIKLRHPNRLVTAEESAQMVQAMLNGRPSDEYGVWVYYPWANKVVHLVDETEFIELRTSRNQYKITKDERDLLLTKKVGVIGLSVGNSIALTLALERTVGELRLADFDDLELTNLNRIRTPLFNLGEAKVVVTAREIAEIDPFIKVVCFPEGITESNIDGFFEDGGLLDVVVDECDGLDIKVLCRQKARALQIPVLMDTCDRGMIDVERFDLHPERSILHGLIDHLDIDNLKNLKTSEEKVPYLMPMVGADSMSFRLKASGIELGETITTWPQLGSAVTLGGAVLADTYRRIMLGQFTSSGRYYVDLDQMLEEPSNEPPVHRVNNHQPLSWERIEAMASDIPNFEGDVAVSDSDVEKIVEAAGLAPSGGNSQPWKWYARGAQLMLFFDKSESYSFMDFDFSASYLSLGGAIENAVIMAQSLGYGVRCTQFPAEAHEALIAVIQLTKNHVEGETISPDYKHLATAIRERWTNRKILPNSAVDPKVLEDLKGTLNTCNLGIKFITDHKALDQLAEVIAAADRLRVLHPEAHWNFTHTEMRWTPDVAKERRDGIDVTTLELSNNELAGAKLIKDERAAAFLRTMDGGHGLKRITRKIVKAAPLMGYISMEGFDRKKFTDAGRGVERLWLQATAHHLGFHILNVPFAFLARKKQGQLFDIPEDLHPEINRMWDLMEQAIPGWKDGTDVILFRLFNAPPERSKTYRKEVKEILKFG